MKSNQKCVRLSDKVLDYVEKYRGDNFSERLENLVLDFMERRADLEREAEALHEYIDDKLMDMRRVQARLEKMRQVEQRFGSLVDALTALMKDCG